MGLNIIHCDDNELAAMQWLDTHSNQYNASVLCWRCQ